MNYTLYVVQRTDLEMNEYARLSLAPKSCRKTRVAEATNLFTLIGTCPLAAFCEIQ